MGRTKVRDPEMAWWDWRLKREKEAEDLQRFLRAYKRATGFVLKADKQTEAPDFICIRPDGSRIGVELTQLLRSPKNAVWDAILNYSDEMDAGEAFERLGDILLKKAEKVKKYTEPMNILVVLNCEADFGILSRMASDIPRSDFNEYGFAEIWLADYMGVRVGAHSEVQLFGLYPGHLRMLTPRPDSDLKPYG